MTRIIKAATVAAVLIALATQTSAQVVEREATGIAVIRGRVFAGSTGRPLRRARVMLANIDGGESRTATTDVDGRYELRDLAPGDYSIAAARSGFVTMRYGQRRPAEHERTVSLQDKQTVERIDFTLPRMSIIGGRITDEAGEPFAGVRVVVMRPEYFEGARRLVAVRDRTTDATGQYRVLGLTPDTYYLLATIRDTWTVIEEGRERQIGYTSTYFPGTPDIADAAPLAVGLGAEMAGADFSMIRGGVASVSGSAVDSQGRPLQGETVYLTQEFRSRSLTRVFPVSGSALVAPDGSFVLKNLPPGHYKLTMRVSRDEGAGLGLRETSANVIAVDGADIEGVRLVTQPPWSISGQVLTETGQSPVFARGRMRLEPKLVSGDADPGAGGDVDGWVRADGTFTVARVFGAARLQVTMPRGWTLKSVLQDGRDITDAAIEARGGQQLAGLQVIVSERTSTVGGRVTDGQEAPSPDATVVVFGADSERWFESSRFVRATRPDAEGRFEIRGLPAGEYLAVALGYVEDGRWHDPEYLESIRHVGQRLLLGDGGSQTLSLRVLDR
jgi:protocatechuate 3,4-dioxygenase beta subunit